MNLDFMHGITHSLILCSNKLFLILYNICRHVCIKLIELRSIARVYEVIVAIAISPEHGSCIELFC